MNYYDVLEISQNASPEVIQNAYKTLAKKYHPDVYQGDAEEAEEQMKLLNEAYAILSDPQKRMEYDCKQKDKQSYSDTPNMKENDTADGSTSNEEQPTVKNMHDKPFFVLRWGFITLLMFLSVILEAKWMFWTSILLGCARFYVNLKEPAYKTHGIVKAISIGVVGTMIITCFGMHYNDTSDTVQQLDEAEYVSNDMVQQFDVTEYASKLQLSDDMTDFDIALAYFEFISAYTEEHDIKLYETKNISKILKEAAKLWESASEDTISYVSKEDKLFSEEYWKKTVSSSGSTYIGKTKNNMPSGVGILIEKKKQDSVCYIGEFKDGRYNGVGFLMRLEYNNVWHMEYCGEFKDGMYHGKGQSFSLYCDYVYGHAPCIEIISVSAGDYKKNKLDGKYKEYYYGWLSWDADLDANGTGDVKIYYDNSNQIYYKGKMKNGAKHGKGTLYSENGDVIYSGNWKNGDYD